MSSLILSCCKQGQKKNGVDLGPLYLKDFFGQSRFKSSSITEIAVDKFDTDEGYIKTFQKHQESLQNNIIPITLGGDHSIGHYTVGSSLEYFGDNLLVLWIDAHADINTHKSSKSGNSHGMPLSGLIGLEDKWIPEITKKLKPENLVYFGIRDLDDFETKVLEQLNIKTITLAELTKYVEQYNNVHISFDVDSLDGKYLNSTGTIATGGITPEEVIECFNIVGQKLKAFDITEFNPEIGDLNQSLNTIKNIIHKL